MKNFNYATQGVCSRNISFDIEKGTFLELFSLMYKNSKNIVRECTDLEEMDEALKDKVILTLPKNP